jgi:hypothetical protein
MAPDAEKRERWTMILFSRRFRLWWAAGCLAVAGVLLAYDAAARSRSDRALLAPSAAGLWWSVLAGAVIGVGVSLHERYCFRHKRDFMLRFYEATWQDRLRGPLQRENLWLNAWVLIAYILLIVGCMLNEILCLPALCVANVEMAFNARLAEEFRGEVERRAQNASSPGVVHG